MVEDNAIIALAQVSAIMKFGYAASSVHPGEDGVRKSAQRLTEHTKPQRT